MSEEMKHRQWYCNALNMWMEHWGVEMTQKNRAQIYEQECEFNHYWVASGKKIPDMRRTLSQIYYGM
jgi:hypothetical protein